MRVLSINFENRRVDLEQRAKRIGGKIAPFVPKHTSIKIGDFGSGAENCGAKIMLPSWMLLKCKDIPSEFRVKNASDSRLYNGKFLAKVVLWINPILKQNHLPMLDLRKNPNEFLFLREMLYFFRDSKLSEKAKDFTLGHEAAHTYQYVRILHEELSLSTATSFFLLFVPQFLMNAFGFSYISQDAEKQADLLGAKACRDARGGIYSFKTHRDLNKALLQRFSSLQNIDKLGNFIGDKDHPPLTDRIAYLKKIHI